MDTPTIRTASAPAPRQVGVMAWHVPEDPLNPYQHLLRDALGRCGVAFEFLPGPREACERAARAGEAGRVLDLHWLPRARLGPRNLIELVHYSLAVRRFRRAGGAVV